MKRPVFVVVGPTRGGMQPVAGRERFLHGGQRYRALADEILSPNGEVRHLAWEPDTPIDEGAGGFDAAFAVAGALITTPWLPISIDLPPLDDDRLGRAPHLKVIAGTHDFRFGWIDFDAAARRGIVVIDTSRAMTSTVAEFGVAITLALLRDIPAAIEVVRAGGWMAPMDGGGYLFRDLAECRVGLAGYGSINRHFRGYVAPYGCEVAAFDPLVDDAVFVTDGVERLGSLTALAGRSDILVVAIPPMPSTLGIVDAAVIDALAPGSLFVLLSRMAVVDQEALWRRVRAQELRAAVDVFDPEPPPADAWFRTAPNVLPTPHIAGNPQFAHERCFREACVDAVRVLAGEQPRHVATVRDKRLYEGSLGQGGAASVGR
jgi:phosphoglycerate dehydrogenase-like enzyme